MTEPADLLLWPDAVDAFDADRVCSLRSAATRKTWGYTYRMLQRRNPAKPLAGSGPTVSSRSSPNVETQGHGSAVAVVHDMLNC